MNKTIKKIVALSMGATMLAGTAAMALATDLSDYPAPFVKDGVFVGKIVIGEKAASIDTVGALDIAASLQRAATVPVSGSGTTQTAVAADGYQFEENSILTLGGTLTSVGITTLDDSDLPELLASGTVEADDGSEYDYDVEIQVGSSTGVVSANVNADSDLADLYENKEPVVFFDLTSGKLFYELVVDFEDTWNATDFVNSETIELFGTAYTFDPDNDGGRELTLYGSETTLLVAKGGKETVTFKGKEYTVEVLGGNSDDSTAIVRINGDTRTLEEGDSKTLGGLPIYVKNVFVSNIGGDDVSVQLFVGSNKLVLDASDGTVTVNEVDLDEVVVDVDGTDVNWGNVDTITFTVTPSSGDDDHEVNYLLPGTGNGYVDPVFGAFKFEFVGAEDLAAGKEGLHFLRNSGFLDVEFMSKAGKTTLTLCEEGALEADIFNGATFDELTEDDIFIYNDGSGTDWTTHVLQVKSINKGNDTADEDFEVVFEDLTNDKEYTVTSNDKAIDSDIALFVGAGETDREHIDMGTATGGAPTAYNPILYTEAGARVRFVNNGTVIANAASLTCGDLGSFEVTEDYEADAEDTTAVVFNVTYTYDEGTDEEYDLDSTLADIGNHDDIDYALTEFGTYVATETDDSGAYVKVYLPAEEVGYDMFLLPVASEVTVSSASAGGAVKLYPITLGMAILDSEADLGSKPYIVVGGPCANTVAAELLNSGTNCADGFTEGKAMIKLYSSQNAMLVAGFSGKDTQGACRVVASYTDPKYALSGTEVEVITTTLSDLTVKKLS